MNLSQSLHKVKLLFFRVYGKSFYEKIFALLVLTFIISGFEILAATLLSPIFNMISSRSADGTFLKIYFGEYVEDYSSALIIVLALFLLVNIFKNIFSILYANISTVLRLDFTKNLRDRVFKNIASTFYQLDKTKEYNMGELNNIIILETYNINTSIAALLGFINALFISILLIVYLLYIEFINTLIISVFVLFILYINKYFFQKIGEASQEASIKRGIMSGIFNEIIRNIKVVYTKNAFDYESKRFEKSNNEERVVTQKRDFFTNYSAPVTEILSILAMVLTIYTITSKIDNIGDSIVYIYIIFRLMPYIKMINNNKVQLVSSLGAIDNIIHYTANGELEISKDKKNIDSVSTINITNLSFSYDEKKNILDGFNLAVSKGDVVEIVGKSGSGKSTLFDILLKIREGYGGNILVNNIELKDLSSSSWYAKIGYVPQEPILFENSLAYNVAYPNEINISKVKECLKKASLEEFVNKLDYHVGESGNKLSGGQKQRVTIARALYNDPDVIFFDEATSALDGKAEENIVDAINNLSKDIIVLVITHRELNMDYTNKIKLKDNCEKND